jgi:hypothetical protein
MKKKKKYKILIKIETIFSVESSFYTQKKKTVFLDTLLKDEKKFVTKKTNLENCEGRKIKPPEKPYDKFVLFLNPSERQQLTNCFFQTFDHFHIS